MPRRTYHPSDRPRPEPRRAPTWDRVDRSTAAWELLAALVRQTIESRSRAAVRPSGAAPLTGSGTSGRRLESAPPSDRSGGLVAPLPPGGSLVTIRNVCPLEKEAGAQGLRGAVSYS